MQYPHIALLALLSLVLGTACGPADTDNADTGTPDTGPTMQADAGDTSADNDGDATDGLQVLSVQPPKGPAAGGTQVAIAGRGFAEGASVTIGDNPAADVTIKSAYSITATTPPADASGKVAVTVELGDGSSDTLADGFEYTGEVQKLEVGWCKLQHPPTAETTTEAPTDPIYGRLFVEGCTDGDAQCKEVIAELGYGPADGDPTATSDAFRWVTATYNADFSENDNDEYQAALDPGEEGEFAYAYRFSVDDGQSWTYCDTDDSSNGFQTDKMGALTVDRADPTVTVEECNLQHPPSIRVEKDKETPTIYGRAKVSGCTDGGKECKQLDGQLGWGPRGTDVSSDPGAFTWQDATYNPGHTSPRDEYQGKLKPSQTGQYAYTYRFSGDDGQSWTYCDIDDTKNGFQTDQMGKLDVVPKNSVQIGWCNIKHPKPSMSVTAGQMTPTVYGRVYVDGCTHEKKPDGSNDPTVECKPVKGQVGWGPKMADASAAPGKFTWSDAAYNAGFTSNDNDEHQATFTAPSSPGAYRYVYRFTGDGGLTWTYCDTDGTSTNGSNGFSAGKSGTLTVKQ